MILDKTNRGFDIAKFADVYDNECRLQKSSSAEENVIWLGVVDANPQIMATDAKKIGLLSKDSDINTGWVPYPISKEALLTTEMLLNRDMVKELLPHLIKFANTGEL